MQHCFRAILFFLVSSFLLACIGVAPAAADSPDNLMIMRAKLGPGKGKTVVVLSAPAAQQKIGTANSGDMVFVVSKTTVGDDAWYEIRTAPETTGAGWPGSGWVPAASIDAFDSPGDNGGGLYAPEYMYPPENRLAYRLTLDYGYYPEACFKILGKPLKHDQAYSRVVTDYLKYRHLLVMLVRTTKRVTGGEVAAITVDPRRGGDVSFGPLKIGEDAASLKKVFPDYSGLDGVWMFGGEHRFRFAVSDGRIRSMQYGGPLARSGFGNADILYPLPVAAKAGYVEFFGMLQQATYRPNDLNKTPWAEASYLGGKLLRLSSGQDAPDLVLLVQEDGKRWDAHVDHCLADIAMCQAFETHMPAGGRLMSLIPQQTEDSDVFAFRVELDPSFNARLAKRQDLSGFMQKLRDMEGIYKIK